MLTEGSGGSSGGMAGEHQPDEPVRDGGSCVFRIYTPRLMPTWVTLQSGLGWLSLLRSERRGNSVNVHKRLVDCHLGTARQRFCWIGKEPALAEASPKQRCAHTASNG